MKLLAQEIADQEIDMVVRALTAALLLALLIAEPAGAATVHDESVSSMD